MSNDYTYTAEEAKSAIAAVLPEVEELLTTDIPNSKAIFAETAKATGVGDCIRAADAMNTTLDGLVALLKQLVGESTDSVKAGTAYGAYNYAKGQVDLLS